MCARTYSDLLLAPEAAVSVELPHFTPNAMSK